MPAATLRYCRDLLSQGWCVQVIEDVSAGVVAGYWIYERPASELDVLVGSDMSVQRHLVNRRSGPKLISGLEEFRTFDRFADEHHLRLRHYRVRRA